MRATIEPDSCKAEVVKQYSSPDITLELADQDSHINVALSVEMAEKIAESLTTAVKEHAEFYERIRVEREARRQ